MSRMLVIVLGVCLGLVAVSGCEHQLSDKDLGEIQTDARELPGADWQYSLPKFKESQKDTDAEEADQGEDI